MGKQIKFVTEKDLKVLNRQLKIGSKVYGTVDIETRMSPWEDARLYVERTVTGRCWVSQQWQVDNSTMTVADMVHTGGAYTQPPAGLRNLDGPGPQVAGPLPAGREFDRGLNESELATLQHRVDADDLRDKKSGRGTGKSRWW
ncbi:hypothetical protein ACIBI8_40460 [Streptomyces sp. NPDC050529]|uniref:hypothetical protein n=1 Tax=Streptomyces sp. NPDC050529 TaxID=3365624 RepID=UPI0037A5F546